MCRRKHRGTNPVNSNWKQNPYKKEKETVVGWFEQVLTSDFCATVTCPNYYLSLSHAWNCHFALHWQWQLRPPYYYQACHYRLIPNYKDDFYIPTILLSSSPRQHHQRLWPNCRRGIHLTSHSHSYTMTCDGSWFLKWSFSHTVTVRHLIRCKKKNTLGWRAHI